MNLYKHLKNIPPHGIWAFINNRNKTVFISYNLDVLGSLANHIKMMNRQEHPIAALNKHRNVLKLVFLDSVLLDDETARLHVHYWMDKYSKMGYKMYRKLPRVSYTPGYDVWEGKAVVYLKNARNAKKIVGVFKDMFEASSFIETYYQSSVLFPVYAFNKATREYVKGL